MSNLFYDKTFFYAINVFISPSFPNISDFLTYFHAIHRIFPTTTIEQIFVLDASMNPIKIKYDTFITSLYANNFKSTFGPKIYKQIFLPEKPSLADATKYCTIDVLNYMLNRLLKNQECVGTREELEIFWKKVLKIYDLMSKDTVEMKKIKNQEKMALLEKAIDNYRNNHASLVKTTSASQASSTDLSQALEHLSAKQNGQHDSSQLCAIIKDLVAKLLKGDSMGVTSRELLAIVPQQYKAIASANVGFFFALIWQEILKQKEKNTVYLNEDLFALIPRTTEVNNIPANSKGDIVQINKKICSRGNDWKNDIVPSHTDDEMIKYGVALTLACNA